MRRVDLSGLERQQTCSQRLDRRGRSFDELQLELDGRIASNSQRPLGVGLLGVVERRRKSLVALLGWPASEPDRLCSGDGVHKRGDGCRRVLMLPAVWARRRAWTSDEAEGRATELLQSGVIDGFGMRFVRHLMR